MASTRISRSFTSMISLQASLPNQVHEFGTSFLPGSKRPEQRARDDHGVLLFYAAHPHAQMFRLDYDGDTQRIELVHNNRRNLIRHPLLNLKAPRIDVYQAGELGNADDLVMRDVGDVSLAEKRQQV